MFHPQTIKGNLVAQICSRSKLIIFLNLLSCSVYILSCSLNKGSYVYIPEETVGGGIFDLVNCSQ